MTHRAAHSGRRARSRPAVARRSLNSSKGPPRPAIERTLEAQLPSRFGHFRIIGYRCSDTEDDHLAIIKGDVLGQENVLVRVHSECLTGDALGSMRCDCGEQLRTALRRLEAEKRGAILYMRQEGRGIGLSNKVRAYHLQDHGIDTVTANIILGFEADARSYETAACIINDLGIRSVRLMTNNPAKLRELTKLGIRISERVPIIVDPNEVNEYYLRTKQEKLGHLFGIPWARVQPSKKPAPRAVRGKR